MFSYVHLQIVTHKFIPEFKPKYYLKSYANAKRLKRIFLVHMGGNITKQKKFHV